MNRAETTSAWDISETQRLVDHAAVRLLRSSNAALTLTFLHRAFKEHHTISVPNLTYVRAWRIFWLKRAVILREHIVRMHRSTWQVGVGPSSCCLRSSTVTKWRTVFELTTAAERAMQWLEDLHSRPFISAESRFELIFQQLEEIALFSTPDAERRIAALRAQQTALQAQIESVRASNTAEAYTAVQLPERFANVLDLARGLAGDFRQLEENFKEVARALAEAQAQPGATKGRIVGQLLDTHAALKDSSQGQSFYAFWNLLSSPERQQRWRELTPANVSHYRAAQALIVSVSAAKEEGLTPLVDADIEAQTVANGFQSARWLQGTTATLSAIRKEVAAGLSSTLRDAQFHHRNEAALF